MQNIGEGTLDIPAEWYNSTVNIFTDIILPAPRV